MKAGQCAAINVRHWDAKQIRRGHVVTLPGYFTPQQWFVGRLQLLPHEQIALKNGMQLKFHTGTSEVTANVYLLEDNRVEPAVTMLGTVLHKRSAGGRAGRPLHHPLAVARPHHRRRRDH